LLGEKLNIRAQGTQIPLIPLAPTVQMKRDDRFAEVIIITRIVQVERASAETE
jgi:hypothetical protein